MNFDQIHSSIVKHAPALLSVPLRYLPFSMKKYTIEQLLQWQFRQSLAEGELDFLKNHWLKIAITDLHLIWYLTLKDQQLIVSRDESADVIFSGDANDLILIAARKEDPDTLFFQRRLIVEGDTELGLYVKNLMDSIDLDTMPKLLRTSLVQLANFIDLPKEDASYNPL